MVTLGKHMHVEPGRHLRHEHAGLLSQPPGRRLEILLGGELDVGWITFKHGD
jgi:hypothetical protein